MTVGVSTCFSSIKAIAMRATRLDGCGNPVTGPTGSVVSCGFTKLDFKAQIETGTEFVVKTAGGVLAINQKDADSMKRLTVAAEFAQVDPVLYELIVGVRIIEDSLGNYIGYAMDDRPKTNNFALEVWTEIGGAGCGTPAYEWVYTVFPWMTNPMVGDMTYENAAFDFKMSADTRTGSPWGLGPAAYAAQRAGDAVPIQVHEHFAQYLTAAAPPACTCGYLSL